MTTISQAEQYPPSGAAARVVVAGAGFGGLAAVRRLAGTGVQTTLIDRNVYTTFQPLLYQVATGGLAGSDVAYPLRAFTRQYGAAFRHGELAGIDPSARRIRLADGAEFGYDYLILATGAATAYHGIPGAAEHTLSLYTLHDAIALRDHIMATLDRVTLSGLHDQLTVTVIGGGATGVELAGTLADLRTIALPAYFPEIDPARVHVTLIDRSPALLMPFHQRLRDYARRQLVGRGVEIRLGTTIAEVIPGKVVLADSTALTSDITVWAAGVAAPHAAGDWGLPQASSGRILVGPDLRVSGQDRIFAVGDVALIEDQPLPQVAQPAIQMGRYAGAQIIRAMNGDPPGAAFRYHDKGIMATIGRRSAVVQLAQGPRFRGTLAWLAWLGLHLITLLGGRNRMSALLNLSYRYLVWGHGGGVIVGDDPPAMAPGGTPEQVPAAATVPQRPSRPRAR